ncbi:MAG: chorismate synthase [Bacteroidales bacterium]|nr:chorismate synthase [Bacteroidales bacterium]
MNTFGRKFRVSIFGESHGELIGVVLDGVPAGLELSEQDFEQDILRRKSGAKGTTPRVEEDKPQIVSGVFEGHTTGAPLTIVFRNNNTHSSDYEQFAAMPRPGHADLTAAIKWDDCQDPRGSGHFSGRLTLPVVAAGVVAKKVLQDATILDDTPVNAVNARIVELGGIDSSTRPSASLGMTDGTLGMTDGTLEMTNGTLDVSGGMPEAWEEAIDKAMAEGDSLGAVVECTVPKIDPGYGEPFWDSVEAVIAHAIFSIPGVRGIEFGDGFRAAAMRGSEHNDPIGPDGRPTRNGAGGVNGGITNGGAISFRVAFKPTSSISRPQQTFNFQTGEMDTLQVKGRHDACFALRAPVVVEAMTAIALADLVLIK